MRPWFESKHRYIINGDTMKGKKTINGLINLIHLVENHDIYELKGSNKLTEKELYSLGEIKAFIGNILGDELSRFDKRKK